MIPNEDKVRAQSPAHYPIKGLQPWDLQRHMVTSGDAFIDARRSDAIKYAFRMKTNLLEDLKKAKHCLEAAIQRLEELSASGQYYVPESRLQDRKVDMRGLTENTTCCDTNTCVCKMCGQSTESSVHVCDDCMAQEGTNQPSVEPLKGIELEGLRRWLLDQRVQSACPTGTELYFTCNDCVAVKKCNGTWGIRGAVEYQHMPAESIARLRKVVFPHCFAELELRWPGIKWVDKSLHIVIE